MNFVIHHKMLLIHSYPEGRVTRHLTQFLQSRAKTVETLCLLKRSFRSRTSLFSFTPPPHFNVVAAAKSIGQSNILNIEKGEGGIDRMQCNFIEKEGKSTDYGYFLMSVNHFAWDC